MVRHFNGIYQAMHRLEVEKAARCRAALRAFHWIAKVRIIRDLLCCSHRTTEPL
jgi:hypothetical protein